MPRGKFTSHKGRNRRFTNPEELEEERRKEQEKSKWRSKKEISSDDEEEDAKGDKKIDEETDSEEESSEDDDNAKGVQSLIEIENPNRVQKKNKKLSTLNNDLDNAGPQLSRREREEIEKQKAKANYQKLHAEGKTDQARADLARLAIVKQQREEARIKKELDQKKKEDAAKQKAAQTQKALGKK